MNKTDLNSHFSQRFGGRPGFYSIAPGRVNLIGEHTDYNAGFVLPIAIQREIVYAARPRVDESVRLYSREFDDSVEFELNALFKEPSHSWADYVKGVAWALQEEGFALKGFDAVVGGDVPVGAGLSSSAAMEVGAAMAFARVSGLEIEPKRLATLCQKAENRFVGVNCGIMDMFISRLGKKNHALLLDCRDLSTKQVTIAHPSARFVVANTNKPRSLVTSEYNARRAECERGVELLRRFVPDAEALRDIPADVFALRRDELSELTAKRCGYVIAENDRARATAEALERNDLASVGRLMRQSHEGLRDEYEVSCAELDALVEISIEVPGVYGARMTGAGFGGCVVALAELDAVQPLVAAIEDKYPKRTGLVADVYVCEASDGARIESV